MKLKVRKEWKMPEDYDIDEKKFRLEQMMLSGQYIAPQVPPKGLKLYELDASGLKEYNDSNYDGKTIVVANKKNIYDIIVFCGDSVIAQPMRERIKYFELLKSPIPAIKYFQVDKKFFDTLGQFFEKGGKELVIYNSLATYNMSRTMDWDSCVIGQEFLTILTGKALKTIPPNKFCEASDLGEWLFWENVRTGKLLGEGERFADYISGAAIAPVSEAYFYNRPQGVEILLSDGHRITLEQIPKSDKVKIGCIKIGDKIYHPYLMEEKNYEEN